MKSLVAKVALQGATFAFDKLYTYSIPWDLLNSAKAGCRVLVPFGRGNIKRQGMILRVEEEEVKDVKNILSLIDKTPILNSDLLAVCEYLHDSTFCTYYDAIHTLLPAGLTHRLVNFYSANPEFVDKSLLNDSEKDIFLYLSNNSGKSDTDIGKIFGTVPELLEKMVEKGALLKNCDTKQKMKDATQKWVHLAPDFDISSKLTEKQRQVVVLISF